MQGFIHFSYEASEHRLVICGLGSVASTFLLGQAHEAARQRVLTARCPAVPSNFCPGPLRQAADAPYVAPEG